MREPENSGGWTSLGKQKRLLVFLEHSDGIRYGNDVGVGVGVGGIGNGNGNGNGINYNVTVL